MKTGDENVNYSKFIKNLSPKQLQQMNEEKREAEKMLPGFPWVALLFSLILGFATAFLFVVIIRTASPYIEIPAIVLAFYLPFRIRKSSENYISNKYKYEEAIREIDKKYSELMMKNEVN